uniref:NADH-ubiquinone oxidoreductase chain 3 n=1 Tax=Xiphydria sp. ZJUH 2008002 TaxID=2488325 RepID=A0A3G5BC74_9HYME|nr:NADH dehydrogenase subunit 3 [Euxiphydria potanini]AYV97249.1 NADH deshydrogenase subunit 3 [Xiphydria sp. ZJUH 2008002]UYW35401.1 NADH dehydrogenase subunit 3 [Euxiphydria potanini]
MFNLINTMTMLSMICFMMLIMNFLLMKKKKNRNKSSPFECGFDPFSSIRLPFSLRFYLICILFLIFDVEISILMPFILTFKYLNKFYWMMLFIFFIFILLVGLYYEWSEGSLEWSF